jgi:lambda family phage minor tail protein L
VTPAQELHLLEPRAVVALYEVDLRPIGYDRVLRFVDSVLGAPVFYQGERYTPWPLKLSKVEITTDGPLPAPVLEIANNVPTVQGSTPENPQFLTGVVSELLQVYDPVGALFLKRRILRQHLDDGVQPDSTQEFEPLIYEIDSYEIKHDVCTIQMISEMAKLNQDFPADSVAQLRDSE